MKKRNFLIVSLIALASIATSAATAWAVINYTKSSIASTVGSSKPGDEHYKFANNASSSSDIALPDLTLAAERAVEAVVNIENVRQVEVRGMGGIDPFEFFFGPQRGGGNVEPQTREQRSGGSGVILSSDGYIVTNNHVIAGADKLKVTLSNGTSYSATLIGTDPSTDIALVKIDATDLPVLEFADSDDLRLGQWVLAVGNPMGLNSTVTAGIISAKGRSLGAGSAAMLDIQSFIQTDAVVNPGNSGGALVTTDGRLVGINTILKSNTGTYIGYSFAVPSSIVRKVVADIREYGAVQRAVLGIMFSEINNNWLEKFGEELKVTEKEGIYVGDVLEDGAAKEAGIKKGDVIIALNDTPVKTQAAFQEILAKMRPADIVKISVKRDGAVKHYDVTLRNRAGKTELLAKDAVDVVKLLGGNFQKPSEAQLKKLNLKGGLQVVGINPNGMLAKSRVRTGFIITHINNKAVNSVDDLNKITEKIESLDGIYPDGKQVMYQVINN